MKMLRFIQEWLLISVMSFSVNGEVGAYVSSDHFQSNLTHNQATPAVFTDYVQRTLKYDTRQNPIEIQDRYWGDTNFNYDANAQISKAKHPSWQDDFEYGGVQQITAQQTSLNDRDPVASAVHASAQSSSINDHANQRYGYQHGRINERRKSDRETTLWIYDELGRVQEKTEKRHGFRDRTTQYKWNSDDQLTQVITPTKEVWQYQYDAFGRRITKYNPNTKETTHTLWDGDIIAREVRLTGKEVQKTHTEYWHYQPGSFEPIAKQIQSTNERTDELDYKTFYTVTDHIGSPRELFSADGNLAWRGYYTTWGSVHKEEIVGQFETDCNLRYAGQYFDKESGLHYNRHRYYDPESSQYMSPDPIGLQGGLTPQSYAHNPNLFIDPLGLSICKGKVTGNFKTIREKLTLARNGDASAQAEIAYAKYMRSQGKHVDFLTPPNRATSMADFSVNGQIVDVKFLSGIGGNAAGNLAKGVKQVGDNGLVQVIRSSNSKNSLSQFGDFVDNFSPSNKSVSIDVIDQSVLQNFWKF